MNIFCSVILLYKTQHQKDTKKQLNIVHISEMSNFTVLLNQKILFTWIGLYSKNWSSHLLKKFLTSFCTYFVLFHTTTCIVGSTVFAYQNLERFDVALKTCFVIISTFQVFGTFISFGLKMNLVHLVHLELQEIVDGIKNGIFSFVLFLLCIMNLLLNFNLQTNRSSLF